MVHQSDNTFVVSSGDHGNLVLRSESLAKFQTIKIKDAYSCKFNHSSVSKRRGRPRKQINTEEMKCQMYRKDVANHQNLSVQ